MEEEQQPISAQQPNEAELPKDGGYFGRPEAYDYKDIELGADMEYDENLLKDFNELAAKYDLSQKGANELMTMAVRLTKQTRDNFAKALSTTTQSQIESYKEMLRNDKEIGGKNLDSSLKVANIAYEKFADDEVQTLLSRSGLNYHPKIVKMFLEIGRQMDSDKIRPSAFAQPVREAREDILFPSMQ
ncbi:hypothetical protein IKQ26_09795 [bacterium]|nr:hypothetical protein [bacterium]